LISANEYSVSDVIFDPLSSNIISLAVHPDSCVDNKYSSFGFIQKTLLAFICISSAAFDILHVNSFNSKPFNEFEHNIVFAPNDNDVHGTFCNAFS
jgi:hypothetical protein